MSRDINSRYVLTREQTALILGAALLHEVSDYNTRPSDDNWQKTFNKHSRHRLSLCHYLHLNGANSTWTSVL